MKIEMQISDKNIREIETLLNGVRKPTSAVKTAINNTAKKAQKLLAQKTSKQYAGKISQQRTILSKSKIDKSSTKGQQVTIRFKSTVHEPRDFHVLGVSLSENQKIIGRKTTKAGNTAKIKINVLKGSAKEVKGAFLVQFKSGHVAIATRKPGTKKIRSLLSPSYMKMVGNEKVYDANEVSEILNMEVEKVISKALKKGKGVRTWNME